MKKLLVFALTALAVQIQAATINWGFGGDIYLMKPGDISSAKIAYDSDLSVDASAYLALVYVGQGKSLVDISAISSASVIETMKYKLDTDNATYAEWDPYVKATDVMASSYDDGASFAVVWYTGSKFDYIYDATTGAAINSATTVADMARGNVSITPAGETSSLAGAIAVPEPSTAALALAGLALLLKRRKA